MHDPNVTNGSDAFYPAWDDTPADLGDAPQALVDAARALPADTDRMENWAAIWATDTIEVSKQALANVTYQKAGPRKWTIMFSDRDTYLKDADKLKRQQLAKAGARSAAFVNRIFQ